MRRALSWRVSLFPDGILRRPAAAGKPARQVPQGGADGRGQAGAGPDVGRLDADDGDPTGAIGQIIGDAAEGTGVGAEIGGADGGGFQAPQGAGRQTHVGGIEQDEPGWMQAADEAGEIVGGWGGDGELEVLGGRGC